jgi:hypothetical protein
MRPLAAAQSIGRSDQRRKNAVPGVLTQILSLSLVEKKLRSINCLRSAFRVHNRPATPIS